MMSAWLNQVRTGTVGGLILACSQLAVSQSQPSVSSSLVDHYVAQFNALDQQSSPIGIGNESAAAWLEATIPRFECADPTVERTYYFRWWVYRKHVRSTPAGYVITEFLPDVPWAGRYNTISAAAGHHFYEGRWLRNPRYLTDYARFWFKAGEPRRYSFWAADAIRAFLLVYPNRSLATELLPELVANYQQWERTHRDSTGLYWQIDDRDGMEFSIGGSGYRPTINSYQYGDANAIARLADQQQKPRLARQYAQKATALKHLVQTRLWDTKAHFFKTRPRTGPDTLVDVRELQGYLPWYFNLPDSRYTVAWQFLMDSTYFRAPFGPTTAERGHPRFNFSDPHECLWNGPSWPFATTQTLVAMANVLNGPAQPWITRQDYWSLFQTYTRSHQLRQLDGSTVPWIDENLDPFTGEWIARQQLQATDRPDKGRGKDYNHSTYPDLVITGLLGLRPRSDEQLVLNPLLMPDTWTYFRISQLPYHGHLLTIQYDRSGTRYSEGKGFFVWVDGQLLAHRPTLEKIVSRLP